MPTPARPAGAPWRFWKRSSESRWVRTSSDHPRLAQDWLQLSLTASRSVCLSLLVRSDAGKREAAESAMPETNDHRMAIFETVRARVRPGCESRPIEHASVSFLLSGFSAFLVSLSAFVHRSRFVGSGRASRAPQSRTTSTTYLYSTSVDC